MYNMKGQKMQKLFRQSIIPTVILLIISFFTACESATGELTLDTNVPVESITLDQIEFQLPIYSTQKISCTVAPVYATNKNVIWETSDTTVAVVSQEGDVTGIRAGVVEIKAYDAQKEVSATCSVTVVADYYSVQYNLNGGSGEVPVDLSEYIPGQKVTVLGNPAALTRTGYTVDERGWNSRQDGSGAYCKQGQTLFMGQKNITLYAVWHSDGYSITFDTQGGTAAAPSSKNVVYDTPYGELPETSKANNTFEGWYTSPDGTGTKVTSSTIVTLGSEHTLYARWSRPDKVTISGVDVTDSSIKISWTDPPIGDIDYIKTERYDNSDTQNIVKGTQQVTFSGLSPDTPYKFEIETVSTIDGDHSVTETIYIKTTTGSSNKHFYPIYSAQDLADVDTDSNLSNNYILMTDLNLSNYDTGGGWNPIGTNYNEEEQTFDPYVGIFEGNNKIISGLTIDAVYFAGLFHGLGANAEVRNLGLENVSIFGSASVGGLAGTMYNDSAVENCFVTGSLQAGDQNIGGLVGVVNAGAHINNSYSRASVYFYYFYAGGLVGYNLGTVENSYSTGSVTPATSASNYGGLVGINDTGTITNSFYYQTPNNSLGTFATESEMKQQSTYTDTGWDFAGETVNGIADIWSINPAINGGFPYLTDNAP
jgi:hypothetical protein